ncbi:MAG: ABC transporter substrate-binding protein [Candidatus Hydrogenedentota bacterium]|nr:MAG: ABC transporter substrate-binding protein [Candidatus Hydrogenedentota bacterium]
MNVSLKRVTVPIYIIAAFGLSYVAQQTFTPKYTGSETDNVGSPQRIISMAPSITEVLFALDRGDQVVGVTRYCLYPPEAQENTSIGGFMDPNYEAIVALKPDLVILLPIHHDAQARMEQFGITTLSVEHRTLDGILNSIAIIGEATNAASNADALLKNITGRIIAIEEKTASLDRPSVLLSAGRSIGSGKLEEVYVAGKNQWYDDVITLAGGVNAFKNESIQFPALSGEGLYRLNPDVVVEMVPDMKERGFTKEQIVREWDSMPECSAVKNNRVHVFDADYTTIPGPRFIQLIEDLAQVLHPDIDWMAP